MKDSYKTTTFLVPTKILIQPAFEVNEYFITFTSYANCHHDSS